MKFSHLLTSCVTLVIGVALNVTVTPIVRQWMAGASPAGIGEPVRDGGFVATVDNFRCTLEPPAQSVASSNQHGKYCFVNVFFENRGVVAERAGGQFAIRAGDYFFPVVETRGRAFDRIIFPEDRDRGVLIFNIPRNVRPELLVGDVKGNEGDVVVDLSRRVMPP